MQLQFLPAIGALLEGGLYAGPVFNPEDQLLYALVLAKATPPKHLNWEDAQAWAKTVEVDGHTDFKVPDRLQSLLLFHTMRDHIEQGWHWTSTQRSGAGCAWSQSFNYGSQYYDVKSYEGRVRAVRLIQITT